MRPGSAGAPPSRRFVLRWWHVAPALAVLALAAMLIVLATRPPRGADGAPAARGLADATTPEPEAAALSSEAPAELPKRAVTLYWPDAASGLLAPREAEIFATASRLDQLKQVVGLLLAGPAAAGDAAAAGAAATAAPASGDATGEEAAIAGETVAGGPGTLRAPFPEGTALRHVFMDRWGVAHVSLTEAARSPARGGTDWERLAVASLANSLVRSFPDVRGVRLLVEGQEVDTLTGHLDLTRPIAYDAALVAADR